MILGPVLLPYLLDWLDIGVRNICVLYSSESDEEDEAPPPPPVRPNDLPRLHDRLHDLHDRLNDRPPQPLPTTSPTVPSSRSARDRELPGIPNNTSNTRAAHSVPQNTNTLPSRGQLPDPPDDDPPTVPPRREVNQEPKSKSGTHALDFSYSFLLVYLM